MDSQQNDHACLLVFLKEITDYIDKDKPIDVIYLDFQKAVDKTPHKR